MPKRNRLHITLHDLAIVEPGGLVSFPITVEPAGDGQDPAKPLLGFMTVTPGQKPSDGTPYFPVVVEGTAHHATLSFRK